MVELNTRNSIFRAVKKRRTQMKKFLCFIGTCIVCMSSIFAGPFGDLAKTINSFDSGAADTFEGNIPEGQDLFPIIYRYTHDEIQKTDKILDASVTLKEANVLENVYTVHTALYFKFGIGYQCQETICKISAEGNKFKVVTTYMANFNVDKNGKRNGDVIPAATKSMNINSQNVVTDIKKNFSITKGEVYDYWADLGYSDLSIQINVGNYASNKLKAKKWYEKHSLENKKISLNLMFIDINESTIDGHAYRLSGLFASDPEIQVSFYTNDDKFLDAKTKTVFEITGTVKKVDYSSQLTNEYKIRGLELFE